MEYSSVYLSLKPRHRQLEALRLVAMGSSSPLATTAGMLIHSSHKVPNLGIGLTGYKKGQVSYNG
jgi:hypothetical protein